ncbi:MAG: ATP-dependent 6-phosphofructokinase [Spirochaetaceae bacterium]|nr:ATP-dependent 6-phosphofructokinase [Spirochaetaceae bacterium]
MEQKMQDFTVETLGRCTVQSPLGLSSRRGLGRPEFVPDDRFIRYKIETKPHEQDSVTRSELLEVAGPREKMYFSPSHVHAGIVTCGGLCPGLNDVIRAIVRSLWFLYGVRRISGIRYGYKGFLPEYGFNVVELNPEVVDDIHKIGGTMLGTSRGGGEKTGEIVNTIEQLNLNILFAIGGDGTQKGALAIAEEIERRGLKIAVVGIPKTVDNDIEFVEKTFGFDTAVAKASEAVAAAHMEAHSQMNGIGLVKLMGRDSGFIAVHTVLAVHEANFVLIPEVPFQMDGPDGLLANLEKRLRRRGHAVIVVAEGAGQELLVGQPPAEKEKLYDASGNRKLCDIGLYLKDAIQKYFNSKNLEINLKYIDPSYMIRSARAEPVDSMYCERLGNNAVHAAMAGRTKLIIGYTNDEFVHIPIKAAVSRRKLVDPEGSLWRDALEDTQQPIMLPSETL